MLNKTTEIQTAMAVQPLTQKHETRLKIAISHTVSGTVKLLCIGHKRVLLMYNL